MPEFAATGVSEAEYEQAGSKFIDIPHGQTELALRCEVHNFDWDTPGKSFKFEVTVIESGANLGKKEKISGGAQPDGIFSTKRYYQAISGKDIPIKKGHPTPNTDDLIGKQVMGLWKRKRGPKGGVQGAEIVEFVKLEDLFPIPDAPAAATEEGTDSEA